MSAVVITGLKFCFSAPKVVFGDVARSNPGFVYNNLFAAFSIERAIP